MDEEYRSAGLPHVLVVDDEPDLRELVVMTLSRMQIRCMEAESVAEAVSLLNKHGQSKLRLCLTDMRLPDGSGMEIIRHIQQHCPTLPVAMITAHGNMELAITALKSGAFDFLNKPVDLQALRDLVSSALRLQEREQARCAGSDNRCNLLGISPLMDQIRKMTDKLARSQAPVYISGESGTGKELVARLIHSKGARADQPFIAVNCGAIPPDLMESEFFGHLKGSFTGATHNKKGLFQAAQGGTLFLDEVADLPLEMQVKLLRAIQEKAVRPVGAQEEEHVDVRILSATHKDLAARVAEGSFREDLFYRINVIELHLPALRERCEDVEMLASHFLSRLAQEMGIAQPQLSQAALKALLSYPFPGNVRELENILERALTLCEGQVIDVDDLYLNAAGNGAQNNSIQVGGYDPQQVQQMGMEAWLEAMERHILQDALQQTRNNKTAAARLLGISFRTLRYRLKKLGLD